MNPTYYGLQDSDEKAVNKFLSDKVDETCMKLIAAGCIFVDAEGLVNVSLC